MIELLQTWLSEELWDCDGSSSSGISGSLSVSGIEGSEESLSSKPSLKLPAIIVHFKSIL